MVTNPGCSRLRREIYNRNTVEFNCLTDAQS
jgi:hypothetical protein